MEKKIFNELMTKHDKELTITKNNISEKSMELPLMYNKYLDIFSKQLKIFKRLTREREELYGKKYKNYKFFDNHTWSNKHEIETQIFNDTEYQAKKLEYDEQEIQVKQLEMLLANIKSTSYTIRNIVDYERFKMTGL